MLASRQVVARSDEGWARGLGSSRCHSQANKPSPEAIPVRRQPSSPDPTASPARVERPGPRPPVTAPSPPRRRLSPAAGSGTRGSRVRRRPADLRRRPPSAAGSPGSAPRTAPAVRPATRRRSPPGETTTVASYSRPLASRLPSATTRSPSPASHWRACSRRFMATTTPTVPSTSSSSRRGLLPYAPRRGRRPAAPRSGGTQAGGADRRRGRHAGHRQRQHLGRELGDLRRVAVVDGEGEAAARAGAERLVAGLRPPRPGRTRRTAPGRRPPSRWRAGRGGRPSATASASGPAPRRR